MKLYFNFKPLLINDTWCVVTDDKEGIIVAKIPTHIRHKKAVAKTIATLLTNGKFVLEDLV